VAARTRRFLATLGLTVTLWAALPTGAMAECNGPACGPPETGVEGVQGALLIAILVMFGAAMAVAEARRSRN
jgi:hypothetical protein